jgi:hypothetical protein
MNYGKEFIKKYNDYLEKYCGDYVLKYNKSDNSNKNFSRIFSDIEHNLYDELHNLASRKKAQSFFNTGDSLLRKHKNDYKKDITITIIENEIELFFEKNKDHSDFKNFNDFIDAFAKYLALYNMQEYIRTERDLLERLFEKDGHESFFYIRKKNNELNSFHPVTINKSEKKINFLTDLSSNEKMIILHVLFHHNVNNESNIPPTEYFRILSLCSSGLEEKDFYEANTNKTKFNYFRKGVNVSGKFIIEKKKMIDKIIDKLHDLDNITNVISALKKYKNRMV